MGDAAGVSSEARVATAAEDPCRRVEAVFGEENNAGGLSRNNVSGGEDGKGGGDGVVNGGEEGVNSGGNRWPRQETLALLKIRSDMDAAFKDSTLKGPLWEDISRKLAELGYKRSAKKCKEKFENVYKYHKRTKAGRPAGTGKSDAKSYRFFQELEAFDHQPHLATPPPKPQPNIVPTTVTPASPWTANPIITASTPTNNTSTTTPLSNTLVFGFAAPNPTFTAALAPPSVKAPNFPPPAPLVFTSPASSSSTASDEDLLPRHKRKRKWKDFFRRLTRQVMRKQEKMQARFFDAVAKFEAERTAREDAWRKQETAMLMREHEMLMQERSAAATKDAAVIALLQKVSAGDSDRRFTQTKTTNIPTNVSFAITKADPISASLTIPPPTLTTTVLVSPSSAASSSRWPKAEVEALINLRTTLELKYQENSPKGPLWEEISAGMRRIGYNRSSKRCKEKWENINKYYKKVKDNNKRRAEDSKTCPYFHKLDALYREKRKNFTILDGEHAHRHTSANGGFGTEPLMVQPERQWPLQPENNSDVPMNSEEDDDDEELDGDEDRDSSSTEVEVHHHNDEAVGRDHETLINGHGRVSDKIIVTST